MRTVNMRLAMLCGSASCPTGVTSKDPTFATVFRHANEIIFPTGDNGYVNNTLNQIYLFFLATIASKQDNTFSRKKLFTKQIRGLFEHTRSTPEQFITQFCKVLLLGSRAVVSAEIYSVESVVQRLGMLDLVAQSKNA